MGQSGKSSEPTSTPSPETRSRMQRQARAGTGPELALRRALHSRGLRYRVGMRPLAGLRRTGDVVFPRQKIVVFADGCFWHGCTEHRSTPKSNSEWWSRKIEANRRRDAETDRLFQQAGWFVFRVWEHDDAERAGDAIATAVRARLLPSRARRASPTTREPPVH